MLTSQKTALLSEIDSTKAVPPVVLSYFQARLKNRLHDYILAKFFKMEKNCGFTKADLARRIGRKPEVITRLLGAPGNWTLDTVSDLLIGVASEELELSSSAIATKTFVKTQLPTWAFEAAKHTEEKIAQKPAGYIEPASYIEMSICDQPKRGPYLRDSTEGNEGQK